MSTLHTFDQLHCCILKSSQSSHIESKTGKSRTIAIKKGQSHIKSISDGDGDGDGGLVKADESPAASGSESKAEESTEATEGAPLLTEQSRQILILGAIAATIFLVFSLIFTYRDALRPWVEKFESCMAAFCSWLVFPVQLTISILLAIFYPFKECCFGAFDRTDHYLHPWKVTT